MLCAKADDRLHYGRDLPSARAPALIFFFDVQRSDFQDGVSMAPVVPAPLRGELSLPVTLELKALKFQKPL